MPSFKYADPSDKPEECDSCQFTTAALTPYPHGIGSRTPDEVMWLCEICANTTAGNAHQFPDQYSDAGSVLKMIAYVGNMILTAISQGQCAHVETRLVGNPDEYVRVCDACNAVVPDLPRDKDEA